MNLSDLKRAGLCVLAAASLASQPLLALVELDRGVLILNTKFGVTYDSNILGRTTSDGDTLLSFAPTLEYRREGGRGTAQFDLGANFVVYTSEDQHNHEDYFLGGSATIPLAPDSPLSGGVNGRWGRATTINETVGDLVTTTSISLGANGGYAFSERLVGTAGANWGSSKNENFGDNENLGLSLGVSLQEFLFRRLPLSLSYSYSKSESTDDATSALALDTTSHSFNVGTSGQISPKVSGNVSVGFRSTDDNGSNFGSGSGNDTGIVASTSLSWAVDELTQVGLAISKSLAVTPDNQSTDSTTAGLTWTRKLSEQLSANAGVSHSWNSFRGVNRDDKMLSLNAGMDYQIRRNWSAGVSYRYMDNSSDIQVISFERHVVGATVTARF